MTDNSNSQRQDGLKRLGSERLEYLYRLNIHEEVGKKLLKWLKYKFSLALLVVSVIGFLGGRMLIVWTVERRVDEKLRSFDEVIRKTVVKGTDAAIRADVASDSLKELNKQAESLQRRYGQLDRVGMETVETIQKLQIAAEAVEGVKEAGEVVGNIINNLKNNVLPGLVKLELKPHISKLDLITKNKEAIADLTRYTDWSLHKNGLRLIRIEDKLVLSSPFAPGSPVHLTKFGEQILRDSGMKEAIAHNKSKLLKLIRTKKLTSPFETEEVARVVINNFDFGGEYVQRFEVYIFNHPEAKMFDLLDIAAIHLRDIALEELGIPVGP